MATDNADTPENLSSKQRRALEALRRQAQAASERTRETGRAAASGAAAASRRVGKQAVRDAGRSGIQTDEFVDRREKSRNQEIAERAERAAQVRAPMGGSLRTVGDERVVTEMARASAADGAGLLTGRPRDDDEAEAGYLSFEDTFVGGDDSGQDEDYPETSGPLTFDDPFGLAGGDDR